MNKIGIKNLFVGVVSAAVLTAAPTCYADNPVAQTCFTADPAPMVYKDTLYLVTSQDEDDARGFHMLDWRCFTTKGMVMDPSPISDGNHPGVIDFKGKSYVFGFSYTLNWEIADIKRERRSVCVAEMTYNDDGTIQKVPWWTPEGVPQVGHLNPFEQVDAATICYEKGIKAKPRGGDKPGMYVSATNNGAYIKIKGVDFGEKGAASFSASVSSATPGATIALRLDSETGKTVGSLKPAAAGASDDWQTQSCKITGARGVHDLYLKFFGSASTIMNLDWWKFE
jgi:hypothetical protein